jgi:hypothetical protein
VTHTGKPSRRHTGGILGVLATLILVGAPNASADSPATAMGGPADSSAIPGVTSTGDVVPAAHGSSASVSEHNISPPDLSKPFNYDYSWDPIVATHPTDPDRIAVSYHTYRSRSGSCSTLVSGLRITDNGGATWHEAKGMPWAGTGRAPNWHAAIAWGPGPDPHGPARLYWADTTVPGCNYNQHRLSLAYSDDEGRTWSRMFTEHAHPPTLGGYPDITVDRNPDSPNYGVVYVAYNWFPNPSTPPRFTLLASRDFGRTWQGTQIPAVSAPAHYPFAYRIGYRIRTGPDGSIYAAFNQDNRTSPVGSHGRLGFGFTRVRYDRVTGRFKVRKPTMVRTVALNPYTIGSRSAPGSTDVQRLQVKWTYGLDVDQSTGKVYLALPDYVTSPKPGTARGRIFIGSSSDAGKTWSWSRLPQLPKVNGRPQSAHKPTLAVQEGRVFVGVHGLVDLPYGTSPRAGKATVGNLYSVSTNGGKSFSTPVPISSKRWNLESLADTSNRAGLRDRAEFLADGRVIYVYGDGRLARPSPDHREGRSQIFAALISL